MRILVTCDNYIPCSETKAAGGAEKVLMSTCKVLKRMGHDVHIMCPDESDIPSYTHIKLGSKSKQAYVNEGEKPPRTLNKMAVSAIQSACASYDYDLILNHHKQPAVIKHLATLKQIPRISYVHNAAIFGLFSLGANEAYKEFSESGGYCCAVSEWAKHNNNASVEGCCDDVHIIQIAHEHKIALEPEYNVMSVNRFVDWKNPHFAPHLMNRTKNGILIGYAEDVEDKYYQGAMLPALALDGYTHVKTTTTSEVQEYMAKSAIFLQTSHLETSSCTQFEASQVGTPSLIVTKNDEGYHGSTQGSFLTGLEDYYRVVNTYRKRLNGAIDLLEKAYNEFIEFASDVSNRQKLADAIYDNFNEEVWYDSFIDMLKRYEHNKSIRIAGL